MKKRQAKSGAAKKSEKQIKSQQALQLTWELKGRLKSIQMYYLHIGGMLVKVRDEKIFADLGHADIEDYAAKRLNLGRSSLFEYIRIYDWAKASHPEWLVAHPKGHIPELSDVGDLIWIEAKLADKSLNTESRARLEALRAKGLAGALRQRDLREFRKKSTQAQDPCKVYLSQLLSLRRKGLRVKNLPGEAITKLDDVIEVIQNAIAVVKAGDAFGQPV
jgi:hypothetical protein